ncbi:AOR [Symbiodinium pilosum]|uniref:AOR protein n=1 Tax=Symbiodinium pilosum TaxID=2952 RepID=A0A812W7Y2_SYMPI|nr:AOR [Symbiodinium pilosum]
MGILTSLAKVFCLHVVLIVGVLAYELAILYNSSARYKPALTDASQTMRAAQFAQPGPTSVIKVVQIPRPRCCETTQVLIKVGTGGLNPVDFKQRRNPTLEQMRPLPAVSGFDFSGEVLQIGSGVLGFRPGDTVYGMLPLLGQSWGAFQEYVVTNYTIIAHVPSKIPAREAAGLPLVGLTVVQSLAPVLRVWQRNGESSKGKKILIQAGAGGVGSFAIQYCKNVLGMYVATTASAAKEELVKSCLEDNRILAKTTKFEDVLTGFDAALDTVTQEYEQRTLASKVLKPGGHYVNILSSDWEPNDGELGPLFIMKAFLKKWANSLLAEYLGLGVYYHCDPVSPDAAGLRSIASWIDAGGLGFRGYARRYGVLDLGIHQEYKEITRTVISFVALSHLMLGDPGHTQELRRNFSSSSSQETTLVFWKTPIGEFKMTLAVLQRGSIIIS